jgi:hypothetical protein
VRACSTAAFMTRDAGYPSLSKRGKAAPPGTSQEVETCYTDVSGYRVHHTPHLQAGLALCLVSHVPQKDSGGETRYLSRTGNAPDRLRQHLDNRCREYPTCPTSLEVFQGSSTEYDKYAVTEPSKGNDTLVERRSHLCAIDSRRERLIKLPPAETPFFQDGVERRDGSAERYSYPRLAGSGGGISR